MANNENLICLSPSEAREWQKGGKASGEPGGEKGRHEANESALTTES